MWTCPNCERVFKTNNQSHSCTKVELDDLFEGKPAELLLAFDGILYRVMEWQPNHVGTATKAIVFTTQKAWLIVKPMSKELDLKIYYSEIIQSPVIKKSFQWGKKWAHHIRIKNEEMITEEVMRILRMGFEYSLKK